MSRRLPLRLLSIALLAAPAPRLAADPPAYEGRRWSLVFGDDFDGASLDGSKWNYHYPWSRTHNHEAYSRVENVSIRDGKLVLTARKESYGGMPYTTGVVNTSGKFHATFGYIEARLRQPSTIGSWPAFWTLQSGWPPEIDIMEFPLSDTSPAHNEKYRFWWNYHWGTVADHRSAGAEVWVSSELSGGFHDYSVEWHPDSLRFFFDGEARGEVRNADAIAQSADMYLILNYAVGGWPGSPPSWPTGGDSYEIDWVRAWKLEEPAELIDLGNIAGGGDGGASTPTPHLGIHPDTGLFGDDPGLDGVVPTAPNPQPVGAPLIDSVFILAADRSAVNTKGTLYSFPAGDSAGSAWDLIGDTSEADGPRGILRLGPKGPFRSGIGIHASSGITFDLDAIRARHGARRASFFSAFAGEGSIGSGGTVNAHVILADAGGRLLHSISTGPHRDDGRLVEVEVPLQARFLTLAAGCAGDGNGGDHGVFADAFLLPCRRTDPGLCGPPPEEMLVFSGSVWTYLDSGNPPAESWTGRTFSTAGWKTGRAPLGYGDGDESTVIGFGGDASNRRITTHFRRSFPVADAAEVSRLSLRLLRDDGAIVHLNGTEILRTNLPAGPVGPMTAAADAIADDDERRWVSAEIEPCLLVEGTNVLAVEVHQSSPTSSDLSFDLALAADRDPAAPASCRTRFRRGDGNDDGKVDISDASFALGWLFLGGAAPGCMAALDGNGDGGIDLSDPVALLGHLFLGGPPPAGPYPACGQASGPSDAALGCAEMPRSCR